jgi:hypothetical protein
MCVYLVRRMRVVQEKCGRRIRAAESAALSAREVRLQMHILSLPRLFVVLNETQFDRVCSRERYSYYG